MKEAVKHYEAALKAAFPNGQTGTVVLYHWNEARASLEQPSQRKPLTEQEIGTMWVTARRNSPVPHVVFARAIEAATASNNF